MKKNVASKGVYEVFNVENYLSSGISRNEVLELKDAFDLLDSGATGKIDPFGTGGLKQS